MGQYFKIVNLDKREYIEPYAFGDGLKLMEFACSANGMMTALAVLLASSNGMGGGDLHLDSKSKWRDVPGRWAGNRIVIAGDYDDDPNSPGCGVYAKCSGEVGPMEEFLEAAGEPVAWKDISYLIMGCLLEDGYFRQEFLKLPDEGINDQWRAYKDKRQREIWKAARPREAFPRAK